MPANSEEIPIVSRRDSYDGGVFIRQQGNTRGRLCLPMATKRRLFAISFLLILTATSVSLAVVISGSQRSSSEESTLKVQTDCGPVSGYRDEHTGVHVFKGIPYALPPVGELRWKPPVSLKSGKKCWNGTLKAYSFSSSCPQFKNKDIIGQEDCLYLNVLTPAPNSKRKLPVLFWLHGGSLYEGSGSDSYIPGYFPNAEFVRDMGIVVVTINYRLNAFGFMTLDVLSESSKTKTSGNYGFMDQILALQWVQKNIANFGGDKNRVTLLGQSSGGTSIFALLAAESAQGLFKTAIAQSLSPVYNKTSKDASKDNLVFIEKAKCDRKSAKMTLECLYGLSQEEVLNAIPWLEYPYWLMEDLSAFPTPGRFDGALAVVDGDVVKYPPGELALQQIGKKGEITVVIGNTAQEIGDAPFHHFSKHEYDKALQFMNASLLKFMSVKDTKMALEMYSNLKPSRGSRPQFIYETMISDMRVICGTDLVTANFSNSPRHTVYRYVDTAIPSHTYYATSKGLDFAFHAWDTLALFGFHHLHHHYKPRKSDIFFMNSLRHQFKHFIEHGYPATEDWRPFPFETALFGNRKLSFTGSSCYHGKQCSFWMKNGFFPYSWIN